MVVPSWWAISLSGRPSRRRVRLARVRRLRGPELLARLLGEGRELTREPFVHRRQADGTPHDAVALVGRA